MLLLFILDFGKEASLDSYNSQNSSRIISTILEGRLREENRNICLWLLWPQLLGAYVREEGREQEEYEILASLLSAVNGPSDYNKLTVSQKIAGLVMIINKANELPKVRLFHKNRRDEEQTLEKEKKQLQQCIKDCKKEKAELDTSLENKIKHKNFPYRKLKKNEIIRNQVAFQNYNKAIKKEIWQAKQQFYQEKLNSIQNDPKRNGRL